MWTAEELADFQREAEEEERRERRVHRRMKLAAIAAAGGTSEIIGQFFEYDFIDPDFIE